MTREELEAALEGHFPESWGPFEANDITHAAARKQLALMPPYSEEIQRRIAEVLDAWAPDLNDYAVERFTTEILDALGEA